jgi:hypothetical protein
VEQQQRLSAAGLVAYEDLAAVDLDELAASLPARGSWGKRHRSGETVWNCAVSVAAPTPREMQSIGEGAENWAKPSAEPPFRAVSTNGPATASRARSIVM